MKLKARAKVNLFLDIVERLDNGYHNLEMIMQSIELSDNITVEVKESPDVTIETVDNLGLSADTLQLLNSDSNIMAKAAYYMLEKYNINKGLAIKLEKNIPMEAGLAGGSSDAAAVIKAVNSLFSLELSKEELREIGKKLGADIPFCIDGGTAYVRGIGEIIKPIRELENFHIVVVSFDFGINTGKAYNTYDENPVSKVKTAEGIIEAINNRDNEKLKAEMFNCFENCMGEFTEYIFDVKKVLKDNGALQALMTGSGPTVFGLFSDREAAENASKKISNLERVSKVIITRVRDD